MGYTIAIAGKGGTGKTTLAALIVRLIKEKKLGSILAVDADPNSNLDEALGIETKETIGSIIDEVALHPQKVPAGMSKDRFIEYQIHTAVAEGEGFDLLTMGRPEGPGCYCYVNNILRNIAGKLIKDYAYTVIDNEAGLEHLSRRTTRACDALVIVSDATKVGLKSAKKIFELAQELEIKIKKSLLIINQFNEGVDKEVIEDLEARGLEYIGNVPTDNDIIRISRDGNSLWELKPDATSLVALRKLQDRLL